MTAATSVTVYATTSCSAQPAIPPIPDVITIALGAATAALLHSSARWKGASYPDIVQMMPTKLMRTATPSGQSVPFSIFHTLLEGLNFGFVVTVAGIIMMTANNAMIFMVDPTALKFATQRVGMELIKPWMIRMKAVRRKVWYSVGT